MIKIYWSERDVAPQPLYYRAMLKQVIRAGLKFLGESDCEISISFVAMDEIQQLNKDYRQKDTPTDVLSFPQNISQNISGDIIICPEIAARQAEEYGHSLDREMAFLTVHGLLHLMGHDHQTTEDEAKMQTAQNAVLEMVGIPR